VVVIESPQCRQSSIGHDVLTRHRRIHLWMMCMEQGERAALWPADIWCFGRLPVHTVVIGTLRRRVLVFVSAVLDIRCHEVCTAVDHSFGLDTVATCCLFFAIVPVYTHPYNSGKNLEHWVLKRQKQTNHQSKWEWPVQQLPMSWKAWKQAIMELITQESTMLQPIYHWCTNHHTHQKWYELV
jgi:hypothetical protein